MRIETDRKSFLLGLGAFAGAMRLDAFGAVADELKKRPAKLKLGVCSDIHSGPWDHGAGFRCACKWWKQEKVDALVIAGDIADCGDIASCGYVRDIIQKTFGDDWPEIVLCWGNHDNGGDEATRLTKKNRARVLKEYFRVDGAGDANLYIKKVRGYAFVVQHWQGNWEKADLGAFLAEHAADVKGPGPFFYVQHPHLRGTCHGPWAWGQDDGRSTETMRKYPNAVCFSGHSHTPLTDERTVWKDGFISIGTASMTNMGAPPGRENSGWGVRNPQQPALSDKLGCHAQLVSVYDDALVIKRRACDFKGEQSKVGDDWIVPLGEGEWSFDRRAAKSLPPAFAAGATLTVERRRGKPRDQKQPETDQWVVSFPTAQAHDGRPRAFDYEVTAVCDSWNCERRVSKRVWSESFMVPFYNDTKAYCVFAEDELPPILGAGNVRFEVRPVSPFDKPGEPLVSAAHPRRKDEKGKGKK